MSTDETKPRRFVFSFVKMPQGFNVVWNMDKSEFPNPIEDFKEIEVIEYRAYQALEAQLADAIAALKKIASMPTWVAPLHDGNDGIFTYGATVDVARQTLKLLGE